MAKVNPSPMSIGSLSEAWKLIGRFSAANVEDLSPYKDSDLDTATANSLLKYELEKGALPLMIRCRINQQGGSAAFKLKVAKAETIEPKFGIVTDTPFEKFYDEAATITFTTHAIDSIAAERGGFYADGISVTPDTTLKGIGNLNTYAKCTFGDMLGFPFQALEMSAITGTWAEIDITNS